jgi:hypothetical protein
MSNGETKADGILGEAAAIAGAVAGIPSPASPALLLFATLEPIIGPEIVKGFGFLFHKLHHSKDHKAAAIAVLAAAQPVANEYLDETYVPPDFMEEGRDV